jgi:hypothetical protein
MKHTKKVLADHPAPKPIDTEALARGVWDAWFGNSCEEVAWTHEAKKLEREDPEVYKEFKAALIADAAAILDRALKRELEENAKQQVT